MKTKNDKKKPSIAPIDLSFIGSKDEDAETRSIASRERVRSVLDSEIEIF